MLKSGFFNSEIVAGRYDREYSAEDFSLCMSSFLSDGVIGIDDTVTDFKVTPATPQDGKITVSVAPGFAWINGRWADNDSDIIATSDRPSATPTIATIRHDVVFLHCDYESRNFSIVVKSGQIQSASTSPSQYDIPQAQDDVHGKEIPLATIKLDILFPDTVAVTIQDSRQFAMVKLGCEGSTDLSNYYTKSETNSLFTQRLTNLSFVKCTQSEYDDMSTHDENTVYLIVEEVT